MKKITADKDRKETYNEGEELWFELLKRLYEFVDELEKKDPKEIDEVNKKAKELKIYLKKCANM